MPVSDDRALQQFQIEALQRINDNLRLLNSGQTETVKALGEMRVSLHGIDVRLVRIESNSVSAEVSMLKQEVKELKEDKARREGAKTFATAMIRNGPVLITLLTGLITVIVVLAVNGKLG